MRTARHFTPHPPGAWKPLLESRRWASGDPHPHPDPDPSQVYVAVSEERYPVY